MIIHRRQVDVGGGDDIAQRDIAEAAVGVIPASTVAAIEAACDAIAARHPAARRIGLLAGQGCLDAGVYQNAFAARGWQAALPGPTDQAAFMAALYRVKAGSLGEAERSVFLACAEATVAAGAQIVIAGCTEVPLLLTAADLAVPLIDPTQVLAQRTVANARGERVP